LDKVDNRDGFQSSLGSLNIRIGESSSTTTISSIIEIEKSSAKSND
jgi:hypothetical protein